ncbi:MAG: hypothetical protein CMP65_01835 [Flavobacteriales bacterium]|nr:hypothetical protein [Flavobacteriales bacterium]|tara:strand:- start:1547 stop:2722 length:1176 start_codon:yes stop_codon:yes gene_type:complete
MHTISKYFFIPFLLISLIFSCENETSLIGENILANDEYVVFILDDSLINIKSSSIQEGPINQSPSNDINLLGGYVDPVFGTNKASFCFEIGLPNNDMSFNVNSIESAKITLPYIGYYGDSLAEYQIEISHLTENINYDFDSNDSINSNVIMNSVNNVEQLSNVRSSGYLELELPNDFVYDNILNLSDEFLQNDSTFKNNFKGLHIKTNSLNSAVMYFNLNSDDAVLNVKYIDSEMQEQENDFPINGVRLNNFQLEDNSDLEQIDSLIFLQSMGGFISEIDLSFLNNFSDSGYIVNEALLSLEVYNDNNGMQIPNKISFIDSNNEEISGGTLNTETSSYEINITREVQKIITDGDSPIIKLYPYQRGASASRIIINNTTSKPIRLKLVLIKV